MNHLLVLSALVASLSIVAVGCSSSTTPSSGSGSGSSSGSSSGTGGGSNTSTTGSSCGCTVQINDDMADLDCGATTCVAGESFSCSATGDLEDNGACGTGTGTGNGSGSGSGSTGTGSGSSGSGSGSGTSASSCPSDGAGDVPGTACTDSSTCEAFDCYCVDGEGHSSGSIRACNSGGCESGTDACAINCDGLGGVDQAVGCN